MSRRKNELSHLGILKKDLDRISPQSVIRGRIGNAKLIGQVVDYLRAGGSLEVPAGFTPSDSKRDGRSTIGAYRDDIKFIKDMAYDLDIHIMHLIERIADYLESGGDLTPPNKK